MTDMTRQQRKLFPRQARRRGFSEGDPRLCAWVGNLYDMSTMTSFSVQNALAWGINF